MNPKTNPSPAIVMMKPQFVSQLPTFYDLQELESFERGTLNVEKPEYLFWTNYHIQWDEIIRLEQVSTQFKDVKRAFYEMLKIAVTRYDVELSIKFIMGKAEDRLKEWNRDLKKHINSRYQPGKGDGQRHRVQRSNEKFFLSLRTAARRANDRCTAYLYPTLESLAQLVICVGRIFKPGHMQRKI